MNSFLKQIWELENKSIKSKVKLQWDFYDELTKLIKKIEDIITKKIIPNYWVEYTEYGYNIIKVKINDTNLNSEKLIVCNFIYKKNDEKFWYIKPQFKISEKSQKTKIYDLEKFSIIKQDDIIKAFIEKLIDIIEEF